MGMKKILSAFTALACGIAFSAYPVASQTVEVQTESSVASQTSEAQIKPFAVMRTAEVDFPFLSGKTGVLIVDRWKEDTLKELLNIAYRSKIGKLEYADSFLTCLSMLKSGKADFFLTCDATAKYVAERNSDLKYVICDDHRALVMVLRPSDAALRDTLNAAIKKLGDSGKIAELYNKFVRDLPAGQEPDMAKLEKIHGAETVYVGVSGDVPPFDYIAADGKPAGYNVALLGEISKLIGKNIEIVSLNSQARYAALESKKIDVFFVSAVAVIKESVAILNSIPEEKEFNKKFIFTEPHHFYVSGILLKK